MRPSDGPAWNPASRKPIPSVAANFTGAGVKVGVFDTGFDAEPKGDHPAAVADILREVISPAWATAGTHGAIVSRVVGGKDLGDGIPAGTAPGVALYQANKPVSLSPATIGASLAALAQRGVRIVNNSWSFGDSKYALPLGAETARDSATVRHYFPPLRDAVLRDGQLLVWASGNEGLANPYLPPGAPFSDPVLERGWLIVTQLAPDGTLMPWSNACGVAANWCVGAEAPGDLKGTSFSSPVVAATAALVSQAYPWMDNSALRQTLLSTADDLGDRTRYGWGRLNPDRAVRGPARFDTGLTLGGDFVARFDDSRSQFYNDISGNAGLTKDGTGALALWGRNTYAGPTTIDKGAVELYGSVASDVNVLAGGKLVADGGVAGASVNNGGTVQAAGRGLRIQGNYRAAGPQATLMTQLGTAVTVEGEAALNDSRLVVTRPDDAYVVRVREPALRAGRLIGRFGAVTGVEGLLYHVSAAYTPTQVDLLVDRNDVATVAQGLYGGQASRLAAARAVETAFQAADAQIQGGHARGVSDAFVAVAAKLQAVDSASALAAALDSVSGQIHASSQALAFQQSGAVNRALSDRVDDLSVPGAQAGGWVHVTGGAGQLRQSGFAGANTRVFGGQAGLDHRLSANAVLGAALNWSEAKADFDRYGGTSKSQGTGLSLYGRYGADVGAYLSGRLGHEWRHADVRRDILAGDRNTVKNGRGDRITSAYVELGRALRLDGARVTPFVGLSYDQLRRGAIDEGGSPFALKADKTSYEQVAGLLGLRLQSAPIAWAGGLTTFSGHGAYRYGNPTSLDFSASFAGAPDARFTVAGIGLRRHTGWAGLGARSRVGADLSWLVNYDLQLGAGGITNNVISAGLRYRFL